MHRAVLVAFAFALALAPAARAEIRSAEACAAALAADPASAREEASVWRRLGGGAPAELCEAKALEATGALGSAALILTNLAENPRRALAPELRLAVYQDAARLWLNAGRADIARAALDNLDRLAPATPERLRLRARAAAAQDDWSAAQASLQALLAADPADARARALLAAAMRLGGDHAAALAAAEAALAQVPDLPDALFEAGAAQVEAGRIEEARAYWLRLIEVHPEHDLAALALRNLAALN